MLMGCSEVDTVCVCVCVCVCVFVRVETLTCLQSADFSPRNVTTLISLHYSSAVQERSEKQFLNIF